MTTLIKTPAHNGYITVNTSEWSNNISATMHTNPGGRLNLTGDSADLVINGVSLNERLGQIEQQLAILVPHPELEQEFEQLTHLRNQYDALAQELREKKRAWDLLKNTDQK